MGQNENLEAGGYFGRRLAPLYSSSLGFKQIVQELYHFMEWKKVVENPYFLIANFSTHDPFVPPSIFCSLKLDFKLTRFFFSCSSSLTNSSSDLYQEKNESVNM